tara:strand:+ start:140 stop:319 length:180 start_codon:yes stop_codon:yes gene_type:complete
MKTTLNIPYLLSPFGNPNLRLNVKKGGYSKKELEHIRRVNEDYEYNQKIYDQQTWRKNR